MAFNFNKLTVKAQEVVQTAIEIAQNLWQPGFRTGTSSRSINSGTGKYC